MDLLESLYAEPDKYQLRPSHMDDIRQDVAVKCWQLKDRAGIRHPKAYIRRIIHNLKVDAVKSGRRQPVNRDVLDDDNPAAVGARARREGKDIERIDRQLDLATVIPRLPPTLRGVIRLTLTGASDRSIARTLGISEPTVRKRKERARQSMRPLLGDYQNIGTGR